MQLKSYKDLRRGMPRFSEVRIDILLGIGGGIAILIACFLPFVYVPLHEMQEGYNYLVVFFIECCVVGAILCFRALYDLRSCRSIIYREIVADTISKHGPILLLTDCHDYSTEHIKNMMIKVLKGWGLTIVDGDGLSWRDRSSRWNADISEQEKGLLRERGCKYVLRLIGGETGDYRVHIWFDTASGKNLFNVLETGIGDAVRMLLASIPLDVRVRTD